MSAPQPDPLAGASITIGVRRYHAATGEFTVVREPRESTGAEPDMYRDRYPLCGCPRCREDGSVTW